MALIADELKSNYTEIDILSRKLSTTTYFSNEEAIDLITYKLKIGKTFKEIEESLFNYHTKIDVKIEYICDSLLYT